MPSKPKKPCNAPGCGDLIDSGSMCEQHRKQFDRHYQQARGSSHSRGYDGNWQRVRLRILDRDDNICQSCLKEGRIVPADSVDHIRPFNGASDPLRLDPSNLVSLCRPCHSRKTVQHDGGWGKFRKEIK
jgi:5-methylcytosine-specific restriction enzyme A